MLLVRSLIQLRILLVLCLSPTVLAQINNLAPLTNCLAVLKLSPEQARENRPVRVRGTVTCYVPASQLCFIQDDTAGIYVLPAPWPKELEVGEVVDVEGTTAEGRFSPIIQWGVIRTTNEKKTLSPRRISIEELNTGRFDCQLVELEGVVQKAEAAGNFVNLTVVVGGSSATALIFSLENAPTNTTDALVRVRGVAGTFYTGDQLTGFGLFLPDASFFNEVRPPPQPFSQDLRSIGKLTWYSPEGALDHRVRVRGVVTLAWPGDSYFISDDSGSVRVTPENPSTVPKTGEIVDVIGFLRNPTTPDTVLVNARWKNAGAANLPPARTMSLPQLLATGANGQLAAIEGTLLSISSTGAVSSLILEDHGQTIRAFSRQPVAPKLVSGTVRLTGVLSTPPGNDSKGAERCLWLANTNGIVTIRPPAVVEPAQSSRVLLAATVLLALLLAAFAWTCHKSSAQAREMATATATRLHDTEKEVGQLKDNRERLGRDLHDHIIQSIYAVGLNLEDCRQSLSDPGRTDSRLKHSLAEINDIIRELRQVILGLESNIIQPKEFRTALKSLALTLGHEQSNRIRLDLDQTTIESLSPSQATELIHVAREAMSNSIRHGHAQTITLSLHPYQSWHRFAVEDDGKGFNAQTTDSTGYGLRNMAKRAEALGAIFTVTAEEGVGTRIVLDIPRQKQHLSNSEPRSRIDR